MDFKRILKWFLIVGGLIEVMIGFFLMVLHPFLKEDNILTVPIFNQMAGTFLFGFGILLIYSSKSIETYRIIPIVNILLRIMMIVFSIIQLPQYPSFFMILIPAMIYDGTWSIIVVILMLHLRLLELKRE
ncbi:MAG: hypothetical protein EU541_03475 [Promethearchaeota archaeon]|nr:MAG: hypothetical protein EU541_03475 [Candidatus Lokiarchaeota archaeon]